MIRIAHFVSGFPVLSETFVLDEIGAFAEEGFENIVVSVRPARLPLRSESDPIPELNNRCLKDFGIRSVLFPGFSPVTPISGFFYDFRVHVRVLPSLLFAGFRYPREGTRMAWAALRVLQSVPLLRKWGIQHCHAHFAHYPAAVAWGCSRSLGTTFSWNAHSYDLHLYRAHLDRRIQDADRIFPVSQRNRDTLVEKREKDSPHGPSTDNISVVRCGIPIEDYPFQGYRPPPRTAGESPLVLGVGRLVDTKGFDTLIEAAGILLREGFPLRVEIVGDGPQKESLRSLAVLRGLADRVVLKGALRREETRNRQLAADVVVQPCRPGKEGLDEIPVVLMEAMALGTPVVSTRFVGIPELIGDGDNGLLVSPDAPEQLAAAIKETLQSVDRTKERVKKARKRIENEYDARKNYRTKARMIRALIKNPIP